MKSSEHKGTSTGSRLQAKPANAFFAKKKAGAFGSSKSSLSSQSPAFFDHTLANIQPTLKVQPAGDAYEREADAMADRVMQQVPQTSTLQPKESQEDSIQSMPVGNGISRLQRQRAFEGPTVLEKNSANEEMPLQDMGQTGVLQAKEDGAGGDVAEGMESDLNSSKGRGSSLPEDTRSKMESAFGNDFGDVNVHTGQEAAKMNDQIGARAFTHGNDIYFNSGEYKPNTSEGDHLLAHELTHTVQQGGEGVKRKEKSIQRAKKKPKSAEKEISKDDVTADIVGSKYIIVFKETGLKHTLDISIKELNMPGISLPDFKKRNESKYTFPIYSARGRGATEQSDNWRNAVRSSVNAKIGDFLQNKNHRDGIYFFRLSKHKNFHIIGNKEQIQDSSYIPKWNRLGKPNSHQVDHIVEHQLGGEDQASTKPQNYELLDTKANLSSGNSIKLERFARIRKSLNYFKDLNKAEPGKFPNLPEEEDIRAGYISTFEKVEAWNLGYNGSGNIYWTYDEIKAGRHLAHLEEIPSKEIAEIEGKDDEALIYVSESLGTPKRLKLKDGKHEGEVNDFFKGLDLEKIEFPPSATGKGTIWFKLNKDFSRKLKTDKELDFELIPLPGRINTFYIKTTQAFNKNIFKKFEGLSPITLNLLTIDDTYGLTINGTIEPDLPLFKGLSIDFFVNAGEMGFNASIPLSILTKNFPKLFNVTDANLQIGYTSKTNAISLQGNIRFVIEKIGEGEIVAAKKDDGFIISGSFIFDKSKFDGQLRVSYSNKTGWGFGGSAKIGPDKLKGVKSAEVNFDYAKDVITVTGSANLSVPGLKTIKINSTIDKDGNFQIIAEAELGQIPGIKGGSVKIIVRSKKGEDFKLGVAGKAIPDFPNVPNLKPEVSFLYDNGLFDVRAKVEYKKGRFDGALELGITNKLVDEKGTPQGEPQKDENISVFGYGSLTVDLFKGSKGTISVRLTPEKNLLVKGSFTVKDYSPFGAGVNIHKKIIEFPPIKIPLVGVPGVSIFFEIGGGAYFKFNWDPLVLKELVITFKETNIQELETAQVDINGELGSKAVAESYMQIKASLGAEVLVVEIRGSLAGQAGIGVEGEAGGKVDATWNNEKGLQLKEITAYITVNPKAIFRLTGSVSVDLDLWVTSINLYYKEWVLAEKAADLSGLSLKVNFPLKFDEQGNLIRPGYEQLNVEKPDFSGEQGKAAMDSGINAEAKKERQLAKDKLRQDIARDMRNSINDEDFSPTRYAKKLQKKYKDDEEMKTFIMDSVEEEVRIREYEEFEQLKQELRKSELSLNQKMSRAMVFKMFRGRINPSDYYAFINELQITEQQKAMARLNQPATV